MNEGTVFVIVDSRNFPWAVCRTMLAAERECGRLAGKFATENCDKPLRIIPGVPEVAP